ncbi:MAG: hypothetical protein Pg6A_11240 [Termitinemataceae bacterium]|nr:MAG: hypothetical protein Pg6A_11240 [Termitinemataceae bacterium]
MKACVVGCIFGKDWTEVYPAVKKYDAYFFTNNPAIKPAVEAAGWNYIFIDMPLSDDPAVSSFQSKYVKFLQFLKHNEFAFFGNYDRIIYTDHKLRLEDQHIKYMLEKLGGYEILIREHPRNRQNIWEEVGDAMFQERYLRFMPQTIDYLRQKIQEGYSEKPTVVATGLILYKHLEQKTIDFTGAVYNDLAKIGTSECQIIWSMLGQKYTDVIKIIKWNEVDIRWEAPQNLFKKFKFLLKETARLIVPLFILILLGKIRGFMLRKNKGAQNAGH